jgi:NAD(P)-dependent dehydrogenase (short-subunit alcohol dehydrogenase family)
VGIERDEDVAKVVAFLTSDESGFVAGSEIVEGGFVKI